MKEFGYYLSYACEIFAKGTGTLLSPNDRALGQSFGNNVVLSMYKMTGQKGWNE